MGILRVIILLPPLLRMFGHFHNQPVSFRELPLTLRGSGEPQDVPHGERRMNDGERGNYGAEKVDRSQIVKCLVNYSERFGMNPTNDREPSAEVLVGE